MKNYLALERTKAIMLAVLIIVFGVLFVALPETAFDIVVQIMGWLFVIVGLIWIISYFVDFKLHLTSIQFVNGALFVCLGVLLLYVPSIYLAIIGLAMAFIGIQYIGSAFEQKKQGEKSWWIDLIYGLVEFILGAVLIVLRYSSVAQTAIMIYLGVSLIIDGIFILVALFTLKKMAKNMKKALN